MPKLKLKTKKGVKKRFSFSKKNKVKRDHANKGHLKKSKNAKRKRQLRHSGVVSSSEQKMIKTLMPYA
ncbi:MAG: 50S ribosomal protein L35 [Candidatus Omnitrophica bacterium]|nr:50S ribosomal protein L35 [Candidatus Omnitrophota bacterium]MDD5747269.1 50S ribosomal protein L35 [Candidatus Omnitrophota bacterium]